MTPDTSSDLNARNIAVQRITQADLDSMGTARQAFFIERINKGQVKIVSADELNAKHDGGKRGKHDIRGGNQNGPLDRLKNKSVRIHMIDGRDLNGTITEIARFEIVLDTEEHAVVILKHGVLTVEEMKIAEQAAAPARGGA